MRQDPGHSPARRSGDLFVGEEDLQQQSGVVTSRKDGSYDAHAGDETDSELLRRRSSRNRKRPARLQDFVVSHRAIQSARSAQFLESNCICLISLCCFQNFREETRPDGGLL